MSVGRIDIVHRHLVKDSDAIKLGETSSGGMSKSPLTTHILDTARGCPAAGVPLHVSQLDGGNKSTIATGVTNSDGRCAGLLSPEQFTKGIYQMHFDVKAYFDKIGVKSFYPFVEVTFEIENPAQHYHVPLLLSPFGYSTYRGS